MKTRDSFHSRYAVPVFQITGLRGLSSQQKSQFLEIVSDPVANFVKRCLKTSVCGLWSE